MSKYKTMKVALRDSLYENVEITYDDDKKETVTGFYEVAEKLAAFALQEKMKMEDFLNDKDKVAFVDFVETKENKEEETTKKEPTDLALKEEKDKETKEETVVRNRRSDRHEEKTKKSWKPTIIKTAIGTIVVFLLVGGYELLRRGYDSDDSRSNKRDEQRDDTNNNSFTKDPGYNSANEAYNAHLDNTYSTIDEYLERGQNIVNNQAMTEAEFFKHLNDTNQMMFSGIEELRRFLNGEGMQGSLYNIALEQMFTVGSNEYYAVRDFCEMRNRILNNAKTNQNQNQTREEILNFLQLYTSFVYTGSDLPGRNFQYSDLDRMSRYCILGLGSAMAQLDVSFNYSANGIIYDRNVLMTDSQNILNDMMTEWEANRFRK